MFCFKFANILQNWLSAKIEGKFYQTYYNDEFFFLYKNSHRYTLNLLLYSQELCSQELYGQELYNQDLQIQELSGPELYGQKLYCQEL